MEMENQPQCAISYASGHLWLVIGKGKDHGVRKNTVPPFKFTTDTKQVK